MDRILTSLIDLVNFVRKYTKKTVFGLIAVSLIVTLSIVFLNTGSKSGELSDAPKAITASADKVVAPAIPETTGDKEELNDETKPATEVKSATTAAPKTVTPAAPAKKVTPAPTPTPAVAKPSPNAVKFIVQTGASASFELGRTVPVRLQFAYTIERDGSYSDPLSGNATYSSGPGKSGDLYCGSGASSNGSGGTAEIIINYKAPAGIYTCGLGTDIGYTRFETRYKVELTETSVTILPGIEIIPGRQI